MKTIQIPDRLFDDFINLIAIGVHHTEIGYKDSEIGMTPVGAKFTRREDAAIKLAKKLIKKHQK